MCIRHLTYIKCLYVWCMRLHTFQIIKSGPLSICTYCLRITEYYALHTEIDACHCHSLHKCLDVVFQIMTTRPRSDLYINLPALRKLDHMLLVSFFWTVDSLQLIEKFSSLIAPYSDRKSWKASETQSSGMLSKVLLHQIATALRPLVWLFTAVMRNGGSQCLACLPVNKEAAPAQTWLCKPNPEGCHGHQQQCFSRNGGPWILSWLPTKGIPCVLP